MLFFFELCKYYNNNKGKLINLDMATSIFFTESKDFKLIKDRILNQEDDYLVYVYADTTNVRIPKDLIMQLPKYGNNLIWIDTAEMDAADLSHHIVLTIGTLVHPEEEIDFYIVSKSSKLEKTTIFLRNQGIPVEMIAPETDKPKAVKTKGTGRRGRPKKAAAEGTPSAKTGKRGRPKKEKPVAENVDTAVKSGKRGRPKKAQAEPVAEAVEAPKKKRGRPGKVQEVAAVVAPEQKKAPKKKAEKPAKKEKKAKKVKVVKESKPRKERVDKEITPEMIQEKLNLFTTSDTNLSTVLSKLFSLKKVARPKFENKLIDFIKRETLEDDTIAEGIFTQLQEMQILEAGGPTGRVLYKD